MYAAILLMSSLAIGFVFTSDEQNYFQVRECWPAYCEEICRPPQKGFILDSDTGRYIADTKLIKKIDSLDCNCYCGSKLGEKCDIDGDCEGGMFCGAGDAPNGPGKCQSLCKHPGFKCSVYSCCEIINDKPTCVCNCNGYKCTKKLYQPICATGSLEFSNRCLFELRNCERGRQGLAKLERKGNGTCAEVRESLGLAHEYTYS